MKCSYCGARMPDDSVYCPVCRAKVPPEYNDRGISDFTGSYGHTDCWEIDETKYRAEYQDAFSRQTTASAQPNVEKKMKYAPVPNQKPHIPGAAPLSGSAFTVRSDDQISSYTETAGSSSAGTADSSFTGSTARNSARHPAPYALSARKNAVGFASIIMIISFFFISISPIGGFALVFAVIGMVLTRISGKVSPFSILAIIVCVISVVAGLFILMV